MPNCAPLSTCRIGSARRCIRRPQLARRLWLAAVAVLSLTIGAHASMLPKTGDVIGEMHDYYVWKTDEDMLEVARADELGLIELMAANPGVDPWLPGKNTRLLLPTMHILPEGPRKGIVINTAELRLYYYDAEDGYLSFPLGVGRDGYLTPVGTTKIVRKQEKPSWHLTPSEIRDHPELPPVIPPGDDNPLGDYAMYLGWPSYLIHGTNTPWGIGRRTSRGCIRMYPEDIEWLFQKVKIGTPVTVVDQRVKLGWKDGELYIEVQPSSMQVDRMEETSQSPGPPDPIPLAQEVDRMLKKAGDDQARLDWQVVETALAERQGYPIRITTPIAPSIPAEATAVAPEVESTAGQSVPPVAQGAATPSAPVVAGTAEKSPPLVPQGTPTISLPPPIAQGTPTISSAPPVAQGTSGQTTQSMPAEMTRPKDAANTGASPTQSATPGNTIDTSPRLPRPPVMAPVTP
jgi:L,D-transpeptidase ErfK/SrfK